MKEIEEIDYATFYHLQFILEQRNLDSDRKSFGEIRHCLYNERAFTPEDFAFECFYVICVAGFKQDYAKVACEKVINFIKSKNGVFEVEDIIEVYRNKNKIRAIKDVWDNRKKYQKQFYSLKTDGEKVDFLGTLPYVGNITKYHLARNLGLNFAKYDIWIQRLAVALYGNDMLLNKVNNSKIDPKVKELCDKMFFDAQKCTGEKIGFIDVVLWRSCQKGLLKIDGMGVFLVDYDNKNDL
jgi:hypothetical protein